MAQHPHHARSRLRGVRRQDAWRVKYAAVLLGLLLWTFSGQAPAQSPVWHIANEYPASSMPGEADTHFARLVAEKTGGTLAVEPVPDAKSGLKTREQLAAVAAGTWAMADSFGGALGDEDPLFLLSTLPFLAPSTADARRLFEIARPAYERRFAARNQKLLYVSPWPASGIWSQSPPGDAAALAGLKIRTYDKTSGEIFTRAGSRAETISFADLPARMATGEINAVLSSGDGGAARRLWDRLKVFTEINYAIPLSFATVNLDAWNRLAPAARAAVEAAAAETSELQWRAMQGRVEQNYVRMRANGMQIVSPAPANLMAALRRAADGAIAEWQQQTGDEGRAILEAYRR
jgi:TRAP-type C4-dicarboxylate transport system substrate-binding protein